MYWYIESLKKYADFSGGTHRKEFWIFYLSNNYIIPFLVGFILSFCPGLLYNVNAEVLGLVIFLYASAIIIPSLAVLVRRLHDTKYQGLES
ncbi:MAG: DUF805 domain-containing protein [Planctomycetota bacterium]|jgi:uncharacterized membrane protein YhaH (DUF805 family)